MESVRVTWEEQRSGGEWLPTTRWRYAGWVQAYVVAHDSTIRAVVRITQQTQLHPVEEGANEPQEANYLSWADLDQLEITDVADGK